MILVIDNYDSFTYNLVQYLGELTGGEGGAELRVARNDQITVAEVEALDPRAIVISPGPGTPRQAGISGPLIRAFAGRRPILGVCLGHQAIGEVFGGAVIRGPVPVHGKTSLIHHDGRGVFAGLPSPFEATRYHSLIVRREDLPSALEVSAWTEDGLIMGLRHREAEVHGVQFHPESILTAVGKDLLANFLRRAGLPVGAYSER
jgi:anthranilate synthase component 2